MELQFLMMVMVFKFMLVCEMEAIEFLRERFGISKHKTLEETIGTHLSIDRVVQELNAFKKQESENLKLKIIEFISKK